MKLDRNSLQVQYITEKDGTQKALILSLAQFDELANKFNQLDTLVEELRKAASSPPKPVTPPPDVVKTVPDDSLQLQITLLKQHYDMLTQIVTDLRQSEVSNAEVDRKLQIQRLINYIDKEAIELRRQLGQLKKNTQSAELYHVPELPSYFVEYPKFFREMKMVILAEASNNQKPPLVIHAPSGRGKSVIAASLARDNDIRQGFPDGIFWLSLGQEADVLAQQVALLRFIDETITNVFDIEEGTQRLKELCATRACLIILDNVWDAQDVLAFNVEGEHCQVLITTSDSNLVNIVQFFIKTIKGYVLEPLSETQAINFFLNNIGQPNLQEDNLPFALSDVVRAGGSSPLTLKLIANLAKNQAPATWQNLLTQVQEREEKELFKKYPPSLIQALHLNVEALGEPADYYLALAVFGDYLHIPQAVAIMLWRYLYHLSEEEAIRFIQELAEKCLIEIDSTSTQKTTLRLYSFQHEYLIAEAELEKLHNHLLAAYRRQCGQHGWVTGPNDGYFFEYLCMHLHHAGRHGELKLLLLDFDWINNKLHATSAHALLNDYEWLEDKDVMVIKQTLYDAATVLHTNKGELANQLLDRLWGEKSLKENKDIQALLNQAKEVSPNWHWQPHFPEGR
jgi:hypothetical protein